MINNNDKIRDRKFQESLDQLRRKILLTKPITVDDYFKAYLDLYGIYHYKKNTEFMRILNEVGYGYTTCRVRDMLCDQAAKYVKNDFKSIIQLDDSIRMRMIDKLTGKKFEDFLIWFYDQQGYFVYKTKRGADKGADFIMGHNGDIIAVQAKRHKKTIGIKAVQEVYAAQQYYRCKSAMVITNNHFTKQAKELAYSCNIRLIDRDELNYMMGQARFYL